LFEQDYTALLLSLASAVRSGIDPLQALVDCQKLFDPETPMHKELEIIQQALDRGFSEKKAISQFASTIKHPDLGLFRLAFLLARKEGSSLGQCLQRLARVTRHRQSFRRKIRSAVAMQKLSAYGIGASALVIGLMQYTSNPAGVAKTFEHPAGVPLLLTGVGCMLFGLIWMLYLARSKI
jgi:Flp pilus assembly protein TadB